MVAVQGVCLAKILAHISIKRSIYVLYIFFCGVTSTHAHAHNQQMWSSGCKQITASTDSPWLKLKDISMGLNVQDVKTHQPVKIPQ